MANKTSAAATKKNPTKPFRKIIVWFWRLFGIGIFSIIFIFLMASWGWLGDMPDHTVLENPKTNLAAEIISSDNKVIGKYYLNDNRTPVEYKDLPKSLVNALVSTEDERYYSHSGIDAKSTLRAILTMGKSGGGSTITQQLSKLLFHKVDNKSTFQRIKQKIKEYVIAVRLERQYTKEEIVTMYFNIYDFNNNADGIKSAAKIYFGKQPAALTIEESAMLVGMFKNSSLYNPIRNEEGVMNRRNVVFGQMLKNGKINQKQHDSLKKLPLGIDYHPDSHKTGIATYFREYLRDFMHNWVKENPKVDDEGNKTKYNIYKDGLKIFVTLDSRMQKYAEIAMTNHMKKLQLEFDNQNKKNKTAPFRNLTKKEIKKTISLAMRRSERWRQMKKKKIAEEAIIASFDVPREMKVFAWEKEIDTVMTPRDSIRYYKKFFGASLLSMEPQTGQVKAWVGGINYKHFQYDQVKQSKRQVGSTFKPLVYATAIDQMHYSPCDTLPNSLHTISAGKWGNIDDWTPKNSDGKYGGYPTLKEALAKSINTISARLVDNVGPRNVINLAEKIGIDTSLMEEYPSIALGSVEVSLYDMVGAYGTFANKGVYTTPYMISRIEDKNGTVLFQHTPETKDVLSEEAAYVTVSLMEGVTRHGSGARLRGKSLVNNSFYKKVVTGYPYNFSNPIAGKTGTTQNNSDGWFMGMVPNLVTGVWFGAEDRATHFSNTRYGQGATMALPIWGMYMKQCYEDTSLHVSKAAFEEPEDLTIEVDCEKWKQQQGGDDPDLDGIFN
jgi:penicillin-binding protein 1A